MPRTGFNSSSKEAELEFEIANIKIGKRQLMTVIIAISGCIITYSLNHGAVMLLGQTYPLPLKFAAVIASALVGLIGGFVLTNNAAVNHSASFAGMSTLAAIANTEQSIVTGVVVGVLYILLENRFEGAGGKLGTCLL